MAAMSDYLEGVLIDHLFRTATFAKPTVIAIAIGLNAPDDTTTGAWADEVPNTFNYGRQVLNPLNTNWDAPSGNNGTTKNTVPIVFGPATGGNWLNYDPSKVIVSQHSTEKPNSTKPPPRQMVSIPMFVVFFSNSLRASRLRKLKSILRSLWPTHRSDKGYSIVLRKSRNWGYCIMMSDQQTS
jgi:hypothetical protein